jgi:hypothetical protein
MPMNSAPSRKSHSAGNVSERNDFDMPTSSVPNAAPTSDVRPPTAAKITISTDDGGATSVGDINPT